MNQCEHFMGVRSMKVGEVEKVGRYTYVVGDGSYSVSVSVRVTNALHSASRLQTNSDGSVNDA